MLIGGCSDADTSAPQSATETSEPVLSDDVKKLLHERNTITAAVKLHQEETGLSLAEAKGQVEAVVESEGIVLGGGE